MIDPIPRWLGIHISGDDVEWEPGVSRHQACVWIAEVSAVGDELQLTDLRIVQELDGSGALPFDRLVQRLARPDYRAAGIDAPFSVPASYLPSGSHLSLLAIIEGIPRKRRPFPAGTDLLTVLAPRLGATGTKEYRKTEQRWQRRDVEVRSAMWGGARPGAPFTAACLTLLHRAGRPIWPFAAADHSALLVEALPAAQLHQWGRPADGYAGDSDLAQQRRIDLVDLLDGCLQMSEPQAQTLVASADAIDAALCTFGAMAVTENRLADEPTLMADAEGWIAVHK